MSAGGMIGDARDILIEESCAAGKAQSNSDTYVGGLVGTIDERCLVRNCYSTVDADQCKHSRWGSRYYIP